MTEYTLLQFPDRLVLVSDEEIKLDASNLNLGDYYLEHTQVNPDRFEIFAKDHDTETIENSRHVIAGHGSLPSVDVTAIAETIGWVDVVKLGLEQGKFLYPDVDNHRVQRVIWASGFDAGFEKAQALNKNKFSEDDMRKCWDEARASAKYEDHRDCERQEWFLHHLKEAKQQPKQWRVEVEMEQYFTGRWIPNTNKTGKLGFDEMPEIDYRPRITNNTIKVTKVIEQ